MLCENPYMYGLLPCACGQCDPCRNRRKKLWASRIMLESFKHAASSFVTLTYSDANLPADRSLHPEHLQSWLKRLRFSVEPRRLRFYACGEYGDLTWRPHYHAVVFGLSPLEVNTVRTTWDKGHVVVGDLTIQSAAYVAGYVTKKMTNRKDVRLDGKQPEFQRMSLRPGIGALAVPDIVRVLGSPAGRDDLRAKGDVPSSLLQGMRHLSLGRYLRSKLREQLGYDKKTPQKIIQALYQEMQLLLQDNVSVPSYEKGIKKTLFKNFLLDNFAQQRLNYSTKSKIYQGAKTI